MDRFSSIHVTKLSFNVFCQKMSQFISLPLHVLQISLFELLESVLSISNEVGNSNRWGGGAIKRIRDSAGICFEDDIPDADIPSKRDSLVHVLCFSLQGSQGQLEMLNQGCNHFPLMILNHYTKAHQLVKDGSINVGLVVQGGWGDLVHVLGLSVLRFSKMGRLEFFMDKAGFEENLIARLSRATTPCLALVIPHAPCNSNGKFKRFFPTCWKKIRCQCP